MKRILIVLLAALVLGGCMVEPIPPIPPTPPVPPIPPDPVDPPPPQVTPVPESTFDDIEVPGPVTQLSTLPPHERKTTVSNREIYVWVLDEERPDGGYKRWEIHVESGKVIIASFKF